MGGPEGFWAAETVDIFENVDGLMLSKEGLSFGDLCLSALYFGTFEDC